MEPEVLDHLRTEFPGSSWALWSERFPEDGCIEEDSEALVKFINANREHLNPSVVLLSLNPSSFAPPAYQNFHSPEARHFDDRLKAFIQDNDLANIKGAYMTDIVPDVVEPDSSNVAPEAAHADHFLKVLHTLGQDSYDVICFSHQGFQKLRDRLDSVVTEECHNIRKIRGPVDGLTLTVYRVWHYSNYGANADKVPALERQLEYLNGQVGGMSE